MMPSFPATIHGLVMFALLILMVTYIIKDRAHLGNPFLFHLWFQLKCHYKRFDLSMLVQGVQGNDVYFLYGNFAYETQLRGFNNYSILNRWTPTNTNTDIPRVTVDDVIAIAESLPGLRRWIVFAYAKSLGYDLTGVIKMQR
jgi:hypothetical protein